jgi:hypothetical protein
MFGLFKKKAPPAPPKAEMVAHPMVIGAGQDLVGYARYRLGAIARHIATHDVDVTERFMDEAKTETFNLIHSLRLRDGITPAEETAALALVGLGKANT